MKKWKVGVWGLGYVGLTTAVAYAKEGVEVYGYDIDRKTVEQLSQGRCPIPNLEKWMGITIEDVMKQGNLKVSTIVASTFDCNVHFIAVPTELNGEPWLDAIVSVTRTLESTDIRPLVIIESTLVPGTVETLRSDNYHLCIAPRRDFFNKPELNLRNLPRVWAADSKQGAKLAKEILSIVCDHLIQADNLTEAEMVKSVENSLLHVPAVYAMQLARAYPHVNIRKVLQLASTHWRIPLYYPSFGTGGYCIPTSSKYVREGAERPDWLTISSETLLMDKIQPEEIAKLFEQCKRVLVMGICYKGDLKVHKGSPAIPIIKRLKEMGVKVYVTDPYYSWQELERITGAIAGDLPTRMDSGDGIIVVTDHQRYKEEVINDRIIGHIPHLDKGVKILDNYGVLEHHRRLFEQMGVSYHVVGDAEWTMNGN